MKITYTGRQVELAPAQLKKLEARFAKIGKLLDGKRECEATSILSLERHLHNAEATVNYYNHQLVGWVQIPTSSPRFTRPPRSWRSRRSRPAPSGATPSARRAKRARSGDANRSDQLAEPEAEPARTGLSGQPPREAQAHDAGGGHARDGQDAAITWSTATPRPIASACCSGAATAISTWYEGHNLAERDAAKQKASPAARNRPLAKPELVVITGLSGSGKGSVLRRWRTWASTRWTICRWS